MEGFTKRPNNITTLTHHKNIALKCFGYTTIALGIYVVYLGHKNDGKIIDADFKVVND